MHLPSFSHGLGEQETKPFTSLGTIVSKASRHKRMDPKQRCQSIFGVFTMGLILNHDILHSSMVAAGSLQVFSSGELNAGVYSLYDP